MVQTGSRGDGGVGEYWDANEWYWNHLPFTVGIVRTPTLTLNEPERKVKSRQTDRLSTIGVSDAHQTVG